MTKKLFKIMMVCLMVLGIAFTAVNFITVKSDSAVYWQQLELGTDPITGGNSIKCFGKGQACVTKTPYDRP